MNKKKILILLGIIIFLAGSAYAGVSIVRVRNNKKAAATNVSTGTSPTTSKDNDTAYFPSPNHNYTVFIGKNRVSGTGYVGVATKEGKITASILTKEETDRVGLGSIPVYYEIQFSKWLDEDNFQLIANYQNGQKYQFSVNASTAKTDPSTFKPVQ